MKRADLVLSVDVEGELAAVRSTEIGVPPVAEVDFKIAFLAPEGQQVKKGDSVLRLDTEMLERQLAEKRAELQEAQKKVEQKQIELGMKLLDLEQQSAQARADLGRAQLKADVPAEVQQRLELEKALLDKRGRERDLQNLDAEGRVTQALTGAELASLRQQRDRAAGRVAALEVAIDKMNIRAPQDGIVIYRPNWRDEKKKVGDSVWFGEVVLALPDLDRDEGRRLRRRGGRRPGARGAEGHAAARGALGLRPRRQGRARSAAPCASAPGARRSRAIGSRSRSRRPTRPSCGRRCASAARWRPAASPGCCWCRARSCSCATRGRSCGCGARSAGARSRSSSAAATAGRSRCSSGVAEGDRLSPLDLALPLERQVAAGGTSR